MLLALGIFLCIALGYTMGLIHKGIHIHVHKPETPKQEGYNESLAPLLPAEIQKYYESTKGQNQF
jgi:hypothetical protein